MITRFIIVFILINSFLIAIFFISLIILRVIFARLQPSCLLIGKAFVHLGPESLSLVAHLVVHGGILTFSIFFVNLFFLALNVLLLKLVDNVFLFVSPLLVFQVVHVQLILEVVNIRVLLYVH